VHGRLIISLHCTFWNMGSLQNNHILSCWGQSGAHVTFLGRVTAVSVFVSTYRFHPNSSSSKWGGSFPRENATEWPSSELALHSLEMLQSLMGVCTVSMMRWHLCLSNNVTLLCYRHLGDVIHVSISGSSQYGLRTFLGSIDDCSWQSAHPLSQ